MTAAGDPTEAGALAPGIILLVMLIAGDTCAAAAAHVTGSSGIDWQTRSQ